MTPVESMLFVVIVNWMKIIRWVLEWNLYGRRSTLAGPLAQRRDEVGEV